MAIAVSVMLFLAALVWIGVAFHHKDPISIGMILVSAAAGVLNLVLPNLGIHISVGIVCFVEAIASLVLMLWIIMENEGDRGVGILLSIGAFLLFAWTTVFGILQLTIVA